MQVIETSIHKASGFLTDFFHTLIKQRQKLNMRSHLAISAQYKRATPNFHNKLAIILHTELWLKK
jgi:hypothetical protein